MKLLNLLIIAASISSMSAMAADESETEKYLGLNEFRHVKETASGMACGDEAWELGNYFEHKSPNRLFAPNNDTLTVKLKAAYFHYAPESSTWRPWVNRLEAQIGIFAEISLKGGNLSAPGTGGIPGRLVFFSDNHFNGQRRIPDVNTNIYGPVMYTGGGLAIKLTSLEFDQEKNDQLKDTLLKSVAELGSKASAGVPSYLEGPLTTLFQSALSAAKSKDDMFGQITFVLDDRNGGDNPLTSPLRTGDIVIVRQTRRDLAVDWKNLCYNVPTAEVFVRSAGGEGDTKTLVLPNAKGTQLSIGGKTYSLPQLNYISISLLKNAGADAGRIQDALTYERLVSELQQRKTDAGLISSVAAVTAALNERAGDRELMRQIDILGQKDKATSMERSDAASLVGRVLYASLLSMKGFDHSTIKPLDDCTFLKTEKIKPEWLTRVFTKLRSYDDKAWTREAFNTLITADPKTCVEANQTLDLFHTMLFPLTASTGQGK